MECEYITTERRARRSGGCLKRVSSNLDPRRYSLSISRGISTLQWGELGGFLSLMMRPRGLTTNYGIYADPWLYAYHVRWISLGDPKKALRKAYWDGARGIPPGFTITSRRWQLGFHRTCRYLNSLARSRRYRSVCLMNKNGRIFPKKRSDV